MRSWFKPSLGQGQFGWQFKLLGRTFPTLLMLEQMTRHRQGNKDNNFKKHPYNYCEICIKKDKTCKRIHIYKHNIYSKYGHFKKIPQTKFDQMYPHCLRDIRNKDLKRWKWKYVGLHSLIYYKPDKGQYLKNIPVVIYNLQHMVFKINRCI